MDAGKFNRIEKRYQMAVLNHYGVSSQIIQIYTKQAAIIS